MDTTVEINLEDGAGLLALLREVFTDEGMTDSELRRRIRAAMFYSFLPERTCFEHRGLVMEAVLNRERFDYVRRTIAEAQPAMSECSDPQARSPSQLRSLMTTRVPHGSPPGHDVCPFDDLDKNPLVMALARLREKNYGLVVNPRPWGYHHLMLVTRDLEPQVMTERDLLAGLFLLKHLGPGYEGIFSSVGASASVYHFHLQVHKGASPLWQTLDRGAVTLEPLHEDQTRVSRMVGWPANGFVVEGTDLSFLAATVQRMIDLLTKGVNDIPYNLGFRCEEQSVRLILFPRSQNGEKPTGLNPYPESWGRFSFLELGGAEFLLTPEGYRATIGQGEAICQAIAQMSLPDAELDRLIRAFRS